VSSFTGLTFVERPDIPKTHGRPFYAVAAFRWYIGFPGSTMWIDIPDGFLTDLVSANHRFLRILPKSWARSLIGPSIVHDRMREDLRFSKLRGDLEFLDAMDVNGTPGPLKWAAFAMVLANNSREQHNRD